jgi:hypothetical protein
MSGTPSSGSSGSSGNTPNLAENTVSRLGAGLAKILENPNGKQTSPPSSPPSETGGAAFVRSSTKGSVASSPLSSTQSGSQKQSARGGGGNAGEAKRVAEAGPPPLSQGFLDAYRQKKPSEEKEKQRKPDEILANVEEKAGAQAMVDQVTGALGILQKRGLLPALLRDTIFFTIDIYEGSDRLFRILNLFRYILHSVGGQLLQSASEVCSCSFCLVRFFMRIFHPNPVPDPELELARLFWRRAFETPDFPEIGEMIFRVLQEQLQILEISRRLYMLFEELGGFGGGHQDPPPRAPKAMPPIVPESMASPFAPCSQECVICMGQLSGQCLMPQCRHALHSHCMSAMFESGIDDCPSCRVQIWTLVRKTLEESPKPSDESPKASDDSSAGGASSGGSPADAAPESPNASEE